MGHGDADNGYYNNYKSGDNQVRKYKFNKGADKQYRKKRPMRYFQSLKRKINKLSPERRDQALREIERHINAMSGILAGENGFPDYQAKTNSDLGNATKNNIPNVNVTKEKNIIKQMVRA